VSITHGFFGSTRDPRFWDGDPAHHGTPPGRLLTLEEVADPFVGMPRINDIPHLGLEGRRRELQVTGDRGRDVS
jgi:hypothetical protein